MTEITTGVFVTWLVIGAVVGAVIGIFAISGRRYSFTTATLLGAGSAPVIALVLVDVDQDSGFGVVLLFVLTAIVVKLGTLLLPRLAISSAAALPGAAKAAGVAVRQEFDVSGVGLYDGSGHHLGPSRISVTKDRVIIEDAGGGVHQVRLRDIASVTTPAPLIAGKVLRIKVPLTTYDINCNSKVQKYAVERCINEELLRGV